MILKTEGKNCMSKRWSKLQSRIYNLMDPRIAFQIHCAIYEMNSNDGYHAYKLPRYFITIGKEIVFDYPKEFDTTRKYNFNVYPWITDISELSNIIEEYVQCPEEKIMDDFDNDIWGVTDILRICDRRVGRRRLKLIKDNTDSETLLRIIALRETIYNNIEQDKVT